MFLDFVHKDALSLVILNFLGSSRWIFDFDILLEWIWSRKSFDAQKEAIKADEK